MSKQVNLVTGECVKMDIDIVVNQEQTFVRVGEKLIAGIVNSDGWHGIYLWYEVNDIYRYIGDFTLHPQPDDSVVWNICTHTIGKEFTEKAVRFLKEQANAWIPGLTGGTQVKMLSIPFGKTEIQIAPKKNWFDSLFNEGRKFLNNFKQAVSCYFAS